MEIQILKNETAIFLGRQPTDEEFQRALPKAERKLNQIIQKEGDNDGMRRNAWYLGKLIQEAIVEFQFEIYTQLTPEQRKEMKNEPINTLS